MPFIASEGCFWPLTASITSEVKNNHAHVTTQKFLNKFIEIKFSVRCMVLAVMLSISTQATSKYIDKILGETDAIDSSLRLMDILMDLHFFSFQKGRCHWRCLEAPMKGLSV